MSRDSVVHIIRRTDNSIAEARLLRGLVPEDLLLVEGEWAAERSVLTQQLLAQGVTRQSWPQSLHWDWRRKAPELRLLAACGVGVVCEGRWQGVMMTKTTPYIARLIVDRGRPLLYIDYLEVAPWNWRIPEIGRDGQFRGIGSALFWNAVQQSREEGFHGRVGLHALPQAEAFYQAGCGMTPLGRDAAKQNLVYFELSRERAENLFREGEER